MEANQIIKNIDVDSTFLSMSLSERLFLNDSRYMNKNGFNLFKPQAQKIEPVKCYQQELKPKYIQQNPLDQLDQVKQQVFLNSGLTEKNSDFEELKKKLDQIRQSVNGLNEELALIKENMVCDKIINKLTIVDDLNQKFDKLTSQFPAQFESLSLKYNLMESKLNETLTTFYFRITEKFDTKFKEIINNQREITLIKKEKKNRLNSIKKKSNQYELLTKLKNKKQLLLKPVLNDFKSSRCVQFKQEREEFEPSQYSSTEQSCVFPSQDKDSCESIIEFDF